MEIRVLDPSVYPADAAAFREIRQQALEREPRSFGESVEEFLATPAETMDARLAPNQDGSFVLGAFVDGQLAGVAGLGRYSRLKLRHKAVVWGVYVSAGHRRKGIGLALLRALCARAAAIEGLQRIELRVAADSAHARAVYEACGFRIYGREEAALLVNGEPVDQFLMVLPVP